MQKFVIVRPNNLHVATTRHPMCVVKVQICTLGGIRGIEIAYLLQHSARVEAIMTCTENVLYRGLLKIKSLE